MAIADQPVALITGSAQRIGAEIARTLHQSGQDIVLHYRSSAAAAETLKQELENQRSDSVLLIQSDLNATDKLADMIRQIEQWRGRLDILVNNASSFYPTPVDSLNLTQWDDLMGSNLKAPFFLSIAAAPLLKKQHGSIINLLDIHAERPMAGHAIYCMAKAGNAMMVKSLARELGPEIRVNGVAPGAILWPDQALDEQEKDNILSRTQLGRLGTPSDIARTVRFLALDAPYITGQILAVDGGRSVQQ
ncbi:MAG: pteridine reductase [Sedimenticola selenatireducens]|uniref:Pteridine reductase n=1 Tax=Sedimenticola selenatireducens TaxID=191960 RepID=A0A557SM82_9GAMM|nr:pteridine reductase [Sedimenticola selenatireducens]TVO78460.1 pteridine reductase [Sedimenticola selenatireducens]TVT62681.1 MAG: pteridine reductase [Sedimenticola selenatireducens]